MTFPGGYFVRRSPFSWGLRPKPRGCFAATRGSHLTLLAFVSHRRSCLALVGLLTPVVFSHWRDHRSQAHDHLLPRIIRYTTYVTCIWHPCLINQWEIILPNLYETITKRIVEQLDKGVVPWRSPYLSQTGFPKNFVSQKQYQGINVLLLASARFSSPYFLTFLQAKNLGGSVRKGEKGFIVVKYGQFSKEADESATSDEKDSKRSFLRSYTVFNAAQIEGIEFPEPSNLPPLSVTERTDRAREIVELMPRRPTIEDGSSVPCYRPLTDSVHMPEKRYFTGEEAFYSTLFHELAHSTGHISRLARKSLMANVGIGSHANTARQTYAEEELVAEMGATFLNAHAGIVEAEIENSAAYLKGWADTLRRKDATSWVVRAASEGQKAADFILGRR